MKKFFLTIAIVAAAATSAFAQVDGLAVGAGYVSSNHIVKSGSNKTTYNFGGFYVGADYKVVEFGPGIAVVPGLYFDSISYTGSDVLGGTRKASETYLTVPVNVAYKIDIVPGTLAIEPFVGPSFSIGLTSKIKYSAGSSTSTENSYADGNYYSRFQLYVGGGISIDIVDMIRVNVGYNYGVLNRNTSTKIDNKVHNAAICFGVAYLF